MAETGTDIHEAAAALNRGELVAIPTETVYGLGANALDARAVAAIFEAKKRPMFDPLIVHIHDIGELPKYAASVPAAAQKLAEAVWPGPLTLVLPKKDFIPDIVTAGHTTVGLRVPAHFLTLELLKQLKFPVAAPSANPFGYVSPTRPEHVDQQLGNEVSYILDGGYCRIGLESTIIGFENNEPVVYRLGGTTIEEITKILGHAVKMQLNQSSNPQAPGQLSSHYSPNKKVVLGEINELLAQHKNQKAGIISFSKKYPAPEGTKHWVLSKEGNLAEAATHLFSALREADEAGIDIVLAELFPDEGLGRAINDRLQRAATK